MLTGIADETGIFMYVHRINAGRMLHKNHGGESMKAANYEDATALGRLLNMDVDYVWNIIRGREYSFASELIMAVLNNRFPSYSHSTVSRGMSGA